MTLIHGGVFLSVGCHVGLWFSAASAVAVVVATIAIYITVS